MASEMPRSRNIRRWHPGASMRPRRDGLGNTHPWNRAANVLDASMRPRRDGLGNAVPSPILGIEFERFNEAEARWPRKSWTIRAGRSRFSPSFNEAEARWPRKEQYSPIRSARFVASMRPRRDGLGNQATTIAAPSPSGGFNEAEARWPRKCRVSWHPAPESQRASMRPRRDGLGNHAGLAHLLLLDIGLQ